MFARKGIGTLMVLVGFGALFSVSRQEAVGIFLVVWGNDLWHGPDFLRATVAKIAHGNGGHPVEQLEDVER